MLSKNMCGPVPYTVRHPCKTRTLAVAASLCRRCCPAGGRSTMASMRPPILRTIDLMKQEWKKNPIKMHFSFRQKVAFSLFTNVKCHDISRRFFHNGTHFFRNHPLKTSSCLRGEGRPHGPTFADAREGLYFIPRQHKELLLFDW